MSPRYHIDRPESEQHNVFLVTQFSPGTFLEDVLGADFIHIDPQLQSEVHRHNHSDNVVLITSGAGTALLDGEEILVARGDRLHIPRGVFHGFRTSAEPLEFVSIQIPPILDKKHGHFDRELSPEP